ncbi:MAG TPA: class I SAM-dependent methyltransferase [Dehalococcoidia bacterium]|nr:class I SAM-dependent methyltransferase [Dehalococcoidia bacterium]
MITRNSCRVCEGTLEFILSLGDHYVSNFPDPGEPDDLKSPLELVLCQKCHLVQLKHTIPAGNLYQNYWYRSGTNQTMRDALADIAHKAEQLVRLHSGDTVLDIGCNDGTLLSSYQTKGIFRVGIDPAENMAAHSRKVVDKVVTEFFGASLFEADPELRGRCPRIITSIAMFYDLEDPKAFVNDIRTVMDPGGLWIVQMSYLPMMLRTNEVGNICHEHLEYYSLQSMEYLLGLCDMEIVDVELNDVNGGSFRTYIRRRGADPESYGDEIQRALASERLRSLHEQEAMIGLASLTPYKEFAAWVERVKQDVVSFVKDAVRNNKSVYVYGASTKGNTVLQYFSLDHTLIKAAAERNPEKWGKVTVGTRIPIVSEEEARRARPDYFLVLPWHFIEEFKRREKDYLLGGGRFIMPAPHFTLI